MPLDNTKITLFGPFDLDLLIAGAPDTSQFARTGLVEDSVVITGETVEKERELADGNKVFWKEGRNIVIEITLSELDPTASTGDLYKIEQADKLTLDFKQADAASNLLTITDLGSVVAHIDAGKMKIVCKKAVALGKEWSDVLSLG